MPAAHTPQTLTQVIPPGGFELPHQVQKVQVIQNWPYIFALLHSFAVNVIFTMPPPTRKHKWLLKKILGQPDKKLKRWSRID